MRKLLIHKGRVVICALLVLLFGASAARANIVVSGTGKVTVVPDLAEIALGVVTEGETASDALEANSTAMRKLFLLLAQFGISEKDVQTIQFNVSPKYRHPSSEPVLIGYTVSNRISVKVRKLADTGKVLDALVQEGANRVASVTFSVSDPERLLDEARAQAMAHAKHKAELYAQSGQVSLGKVIRITEGQDVPPLQWRFEAAQVAKGDGVPVAAGERELTVHLTVVYAIAGNSK